MPRSPERVDGERAALLVAAVAGTAAGLVAAEAGVAATVADQFVAVVGRVAADPVGITRTGITAVGAFSAAHLPATAAAVAAACALGAASGEHGGGEEGWRSLLWRYAVAAVLGLSLWVAVATNGALQTALWAVYVLLAAVYLGESWRGAGRYPFPRVARWLLAVSGVLPVLLLGFRGQYSGTVLAPLYRGHAGVPALVVVAALPAAALVVLTTAAVARRIGT